MRLEGEPHDSDVSFRPSLGRTPAHGWGRRPAALAAEATGKNAVCLYAVRRIFEPSVRSEVPRSPRTNSRAGLRRGNAACPPIATWDAGSPHVCRLVSVAVGGPGYI